MTPLPSISVIIVTYNSASCLRPTLAAVLNQDYPDFEVILVDNQSADDSLTIAREYVSRGLKIIPNPTNRGFAGGNNDGVRASRGELVFLLNPDAVLDPGGLRVIAAAFAQRSDLGILGAKLMDADGETILHCGGRIGLPAHCSLYGVGEKDRGQWDEVREVEFVIGAAFALCRALWDRLGGFDEDFSPVYYEDTDLCVRCRRLGLKVLYWPLLRLIHQGNVSCEYKSPAFWWYHHRHRLWFLMKNYSLPQILFQVLPAEARWYISPASRGLRRFMLRIYYYTLKRYVARKILHIPRRPK
jgi:GT2 family glycosyltransferase